MAEQLAEDEAQGRGFDRGLLRRLFSLALPYKGYAGGALVVLFLESVAQLAGPLLTGAAIDLVFSSKAGPPEGGARLRRPVPRDARPRAPRRPRALDAIAGLYLLSVLATFGFMFLMVEWTSRMGQGVMFDLRTRIFGNLQRADVALYDRTPVGRLMTRLTTDVDALNELFTSGFVSLLGDLAVLGGIVAILFALDPTLATITLGVLDPDGARDELVPEGGARHLPQGAREDRPRELLPAGAPLGDRRRPALPARGGARRTPSGR